MAASAPVADERAEPGRGPLAAPVNGVPPQPAAHWVALEAFQPKGAKNLGNTCYMNVVLQALLQCQQLRSFFLSGLVPIPAPPQDSKIANITASERAESTYRILRALVRCSFARRDHGQSVSRGAEWACFVQCW